MFYKKLQPITLFFKFLLVHAVVIVAFKILQFFLYLSNTTSHIFHIEHFFKNLLADHKRIHYFYPFQSSFPYGSF